MAMRVEPDLELLQLFLGPTTGLQDYQERRDEKYTLSLPHEPMRYSTKEELNAVARGNDANCQ